MSTYLQNDLVFSMIVPKLPSKVCPLQSLPYASVLRTSQRICRPSPPGSNSSSQLTKFQRHPWQNAGTKPGHGRDEGGGAKANGLGSRLLPSPPEGASGRVWFGLVWERVCGRGRGARPDGGPRHRRRWCTFWVRSYHGSQSGERVAPLSMTMVWVVVSTHWRGGKQTDSKKGERADCHPGS